MVAHGVDPDRPTLPGRASQIAQFIGEKWGRYLDIVPGVDVIQDLDGKMWTVDINHDPAAETYRQCHYGKSETIAELNGALRRHALADIINV